MAAYVDEFEDRFGVGPVCRVLAASLDCRLITPRGCRMFRSVPVSRMAARHDAPARDILEVHADFFMAVYGYRKTHARSSAQGLDRPRPGDERHTGIGDPRRAPRRDARRRQTGEGHGRRARSRGTWVEAEAPNRPHVADITYVRMADGLVRLHGVRRRRVRPQDREPGARHHHGHRGAAAAGAGTGGIMGRLAWRHGRSRAPFRPWRAVHRPRVRHRGRGILHASLDRHGRRLVRQRHGREHRRRVQDRARLAAQALPRPGRAGIGDVPVGLVVELEAPAPVLGPQDTGTDRNRVLCEPSGASRPAIRTEQKSSQFNLPVPAP